ncbi:MAG TPA: phosphonate ABC transporter, permease protein PhnE [Methylomirabilota bacterium]|jgi:phosphonate transport system permease protein
MSVTAVAPAVLAEARRRCPAAFGRPWPARAGRAGLWLAFAVVVVLGLWRMEASPARVLQGLGKLGWLIGFMIPPSAGGRLGDLLYAMLETIAMAFLGTLLASLAALPLGVLGARNVVPGLALHFGLRRGFDLLRGVDALIWALMFVNVVGLGPFAGVMALAVSETGTLAKLFAEAVEAADRGPVDGVRAAGASRLLVVRFGMLPQVLPVMLSNALYYFESNTRSATILGVVGAGGIGLQLSDRIRVNNWDEVGFIVLLILGTVTLIDLLSRAVRLRLIGAPSR